MAISKTLATHRAKAHWVTTSYKNQQQGPRYKTTGRERGPEYYDKVFLAGQRHYRVENLASLKLLL